MVTVMFTSGLLRKVSARFSPLRENSSKSLGHGGRNFAECTVRDMTVTSSHGAPGLPFQTESHSVSAMLGSVGSLPHPA